MTAPTRLRSSIAALAALCALAAAALTPSSALAAETQSPQWTVTAVSMPTNFAPGDSSGENVYRVVVTNTGGATSSGMIIVADTLPPGLTLHGAASGREQITGAAMSCTGLTCTYSGAIAPDDNLTLKVPVDVASSPPSSCTAPAGAVSCVTNLVEVSGGGTAKASMSTPTVIGSTPAEFGIARGSATTTLSSEQAGAHADLTTTVAFNTVSDKGSLAGDEKDTTDNLPPGFAGDLTDMPACSVAEFANTQACPADTQVGTVTLALAGNEEIQFQAITPVYNLVPNPGTTAKLAFYAIVFGIQGDVSVRPGDYGLQTTFHNTTESAAEVTSAALTIWGVPGAASHNAMRGLYCHNPGNCEQKFANISSGIGRPFFTNPTQCAGAQLNAEFSVTSWQHPNASVTEKMPFGPLSGCEHLVMKPSMTVQPTTDNAYSATGLDVGLEVPQTYENPEGLATANLKKALVTLPEGMSLNPSAGAGLGSCTEAQLAKETAESVQGEGCPNESFVGTVRIKTPSIPEEASGRLYVATPFQNPFHSLLALYIVAKIPDRGIVVKAAGEVHADPVTGQLTTSFDENPQLPFSLFTLSFRQGATSPLITPPACGTYTAAGELSPYSEPLALLPVQSAFGIHHGVNGGPCPTGGLPPFHPGLVAGTTNNAAGHYSPFYVRLSRQDGEQEITHFSIKLPPGVVGKLAGIPLCSDSAIAQAKAREHEQGGAEEEADPSCPAASEVGRTTVEAGVGNTLAQAPGKVYLAGPYHGSAISVVAITAAKVGPFDLGTVVVREALKVNPETGEVFVDATGSDPLPHIVDGIPTHLRNIRIYMDRPEFVLNPTNCEPKSTASTVLGSGLDFVSEADDNPITVTSPFQVADCAALPFEPKLTLSLQGGTKRGDFPKLKAFLRMNGIGEAAVARAQVTLPHSEFIANAHFDTICTRVQFKEAAGNGENCPAGSIYGWARAKTPILSEPLEGPVFLRSSEHELPDVVASLKGQEINVHLVGHVDSVKGQLRNTFETVPDAPVEWASFSFKGASKGLFENSTDLCAQKNRATVKFTGQNGKRHNYRTAVKVKCPKAHKGHRRAR